MTNLIFIILLSASSPAEGADIQTLIEEGRLNEAAAAMEALPAAFRPRFEGLLLLKQGRPKEAAQAFEEALEHAEGEPAPLFLHLAHAYLLADEPEEALAAAEAAKSASDTLVAQPLLEARARRALGDRAGAFSILHRAAQDFETETRPLLEIVALAHEAELYGLARTWTERLLLRANKAPLDKDTALALFQLLVDDPAAVGLLEAIASHFSDSGAFCARLAHAYALSEKWYAAGRLFETATQLGEDYAFEAADQYRMAGRYRSAHRMNALVGDRDRKQRQRLTILFEERSYARVVALAEPPTDPASLYRQAYAHYALGNRSRAAVLARDLLKPSQESAASFSASAKSLLEAMGLDPEIQ